jgi:hypothetical protein
MCYAHGKQQRLYLINTAHRLGFYAFRPTYFEPTPECQTIRLWPEKPATHVVTIDGECSFHKWDVCCRHGPSLPVNA